MVTAPEVYTAVQVAPPSAEHVHITIIGGCVIPPVQRGSPGLWADRSACTRHGQPEPAPGVPSLFPVAHAPVGSAAVSAGRRAFWPRSAAPGDRPACRTTRISRPVETPCLPVTSNPAHAAGLFEQQRAAFAPLHAHARVALGEFSLQRVQLVVVPVHALRHLMHGGRTGSSRLRRHRSPGVGNLGRKFDCAKCPCQNYKRQPHSGAQESRHHCPRFCVQLVPPVGSNLIWPDSSLQKVRFPDLPTVRGCARTV